MRSVPLVSCVMLVLGALITPRSAAAAEPERPAPAKPRGTSHWSAGDARVFVSSRLEAGLYVKPQVAVGYGKPYWSWVGVEGYPITTTSFGGLYAGLHAALPFLDFRAGVRETYSYYRSWLPAKAHYTASDTNTPHGARSSYATGELELAGVAPVPAGYALASTTLYATIGVPAGTYLYEESLRAVMKAPLIWGNRIGYVLGFGHDDFIKVGGIVEWIVLPGRGVSVLRAGPAVDVTLTDHLEAQATLSPVLAGPDALGIWDGPFGVLGLSYKWATGDPSPAFP